MSDFRPITDSFIASPQITVDEVAEAASMGVRIIINNRPEGESDDQTSGPDIEAAAHAAGLDYVAIPVTHAGFSMPQLEAMQAALASAGSEPVLAYCRSGTRSTLLWALAQAKSGMAPARIATAAARGGYDIAPIRAMVEALAAGE